jgi:hypothetical protein
MVLDVGKLGLAPMRHHVVSFRPAITKTEVGEK